MDQGRQLRVEFLARQADLMVDARRRQRKSRRKGTAGGAMVGLVAVILTAFVTRTSLSWHSFLLEAILCGAAGYLLTVKGGGFLKGIVALPVAYLLAWQLRAIGLDPAVLFAAGDTRAMAAIQGHLLTLCVLIGCGGLFGYVIEE